ncbi:hypothetical protein ABEB36_011993 [Hypothenemus hampei]|uniref:Uncharacterized protein n=1 Tax=Hypothenemus hampei TaxID=57062 RepID=A0ABD1ECD1_HYPHA
MRFNRGLKGNLVLGLSKSSVHFLENSLTQTLASRTRHTDTKMKGEEQSTVKLPKATEIFNFFLMENLRFKMEFLDTNIGMEMGISTVNDRRLERARGSTTV